MENKLLGGQMPLGQTAPEFKTLIDIVKLPSKGNFYQNGKGEIYVEHMSAKDEQILTTPALVENGKATKILIERKVKELNPNVSENNLNMGY